ncbi:MAG: amino acid carrier protein [Firmicutes bacterium]|nr:amino acid carrier protein [Bacillota bacterium]
MVWREWISALWNPWLLALFFIVGGYYSLRTGFFQVFHFRHWMGSTLGPLFRRSRKQAAKGRLTQFQAMATALGATVGTSSIAGVATAIYFGGPGAVFWMWMSAFLGIMTGYAEKVLAIRYRRRDEKGQWKGGPAEYMTRGLKCPAMAKLFCLACLLASFTGGNLVQANSLAWGMQAAFGTEVRIVGVIVAGFVAVVIFGGIGRIGKVSSAMVPVMALLFAGGGLWVLAANHAVLPGVFREIMTSAFTVPALTGGGAGYSVSAALRYGVARGVFTNEAGLGSSAMAHAVADVDREHTQGLWGMLEVFIATLVIATVSALVILSSGIYQPGDALRVIESGLVDSATVGAPLAVRSFETVMGGLAGPFLAICLALFAISSLLGWSYYGERSLEELLGSQKGRGLYRVVFIALILVGSVSKVDVVWELADLCNGLMALPNLTALLLLSPEVLKIWKQAIGQEKTPG